MIKAADFVSAAFCTYIWLSNSISRIVTKQNSCDILQGTLLVQWEYKADGIQKGNHFFGLSGIPNPRPCNVVE